MRGERQLRRGTTVIANGSSPRARGTPLRQAARPCAARFIPACAGNAQHDQRTIRRQAVHPRVRGERDLAVGRPPAPCGSSPRARGTPRAPRARLPRDRFIPACAGNAPPATARACGRPVHPRVRGERMPSTIAAPAPAGSSPRARGTRDCAGDRAVRSRFIPACAGNACSATGRATPAAVHPRVRGERKTCGHQRAPSVGSSPRARGTQTSTCRSARRGGSSPRARGTRVARPVAEHELRFIPACAGNARRSAGSPPARPVHPRVRGERGPAGTGAPLSFGSSPRARGTRAAHRAEHAAPRFIPACAGNAPIPGRPATGTSVHPRVRGERLAGTPRGSWAPGSSPRARGTLSRATPRS